MALSEPREQMVDRLRAWSREIEAVAREAGISEMSLHRVERRAWSGAACIKLTSMCRSPSSNG
jgi:hypothetical protein